MQHWAQASRAAAPPSPRAHTSQSCDLLSHRSSRATEYRFAAAAAAGWDTAPDAEVLHFASVLVARSTSCDGSEDRAAVARPEERLSDSDAAILGIVRARARGGGRSKGKFGRGAGSRPSQGRREYSDGGRRGDGRVREGGAGENVVVRKGGGAYEVKEE